MIEDYLLQVRKPARYTGGEWNVSVKGLDKSAVKFALCFPDLYEIGMSNLGLRILYGLLNSQARVACERFFSPAQDMEEIMRLKNIGLFSLESEKELKYFDIAGFSLSYELSYTNVLNMLDLGGLPLKASERDHTYPLVIGGGPCVLNPEPLHDFFDLFIIGEGEDAIVEVTGLYEQFKNDYKNGKIEKSRLLLEFARIEGVYVPSLYEVKYSDDGKISELVPGLSPVPSKVRKRIVSDLDKAFFPVDWLVPYIEIVHDRITMEVMRGCPNHCRFCQARQQYYPLRVKKAESVFNLSCQAYRNTGYEEISLAGLSVSEYPFIEELMGKLIGEFKDKAVNISLPSIKPKSYLGNLASLIATVKKTGLTFAPEAATDKLRAVMNKDFDLDSFYKALERAYQEGYQRVKLYFMTGIPHEDDGDLDAIIDFAMDVSRRRNKAQKGGAFVNVSINTMIPKPHTPFQWLGMEGIDSMKRKSDYLHSRCKNRKISLNFHDPNMSFLEAVLSRGDRRLSKVIYSAFKLGARFDAWKDQFVFDKWANAFKENGIDPEFYLQPKEQNEILPWEIIDLGVGKEYLSSEYLKAVQSP